MCHLFLFQVAAWLWAHQQCNGTSVGDQAGRAIRLYRQKIRCLATTLGACTLCVFFWGAYVQTYTNHNVLDHVGQVLLSRYSIWFIINIQHFQSSALSKLFGSSALHQWQWEHRKVDGVDTSLSYFSLSYFGQDGNWDGTPCSQQFPRRSAKVFDPDFRRMIFYTFEPLYSYRI